MGKIAERFRKNQAEDRRQSNHYKTVINSAVSKQPIPETQKKGHYNGLCNRSACLAPGATWYNRGSYAFYCANCAWDLSNDPFNKKDAQKLFGGPLCIEITDLKELDGLHVSPW